MECSMTPAGGLQGEAVTTGFCTQARVRTSIGEMVFPVTSEPARGGELVLNTSSISAGQTVVFTSLVITQP